MVKKLNVLFAPIHYVLDRQNSGSEFSWAYEIYKRTQAIPNLNSLYITGGTRGIQDTHVIDCKVFSPERLNLSIHKILIFYMRIFEKVLSIVRSDDIDIIHHVLPFYIGKSFNLSAILLKKDFVVGPIQSPLAVSDSDLSVKDARGFSDNKIDLNAIILKMFLQILNPLFYLLSKLTLQKAKIIIVINQKTKDILRHNGIKEKKIIIIPPGIDINKFRYISYSSKKSKAIELLATGYLLNRKGFDCILEAIANIVSTNKNIFLTIVGDGPQMENLKKKTDKLKIDKYVRFAGFVPNKDINTYYEKSHIYLNMSYAEGFATVCLEAMASGLAIISSKVGGFEDAIQDGVNGYLINKGDSEALANKINYLVENVKFIEKLGEKARETIAEHYDWDKSIIPQYLDIYSKI
jgi:glycosyltransferase involved in cell wall biosynthesis